MAPLRITVRDKRWRREGSAYYRNLILFFGKHPAIFRPLDFAGYAIYSSRHECLKCVSVSSYVNLVASESRLG